MVTATGAVAATAAVPPPRTSNGRWSTSIAPKVCHPTIHGTARLTATPTGAVAAHPADVPGATTTVPDANAVAPNLVPVASPTVMATNTHSASATHTTNDSDVANHSDHPSSIDREPPAEPHL